MLKRLLLALVISFLIITPALADELGPSSTSSVGSDPGTINALQPANSGSIPSANASEGGIGLPDAATSLQPAGTRTDISTLDFNSEADGAPQGESSSPSENHLGALLAGAIGILLVVSAFFLFRISKLVDSPATANTGIQVDGYPNETEPLATNEPTEEFSDASSTIETEAVIAQPQAPLNSSRKKKASKRRGRNSKKT